ncbi:MAG: hypothetical protein ACR2IV_05660, partial [Bryobacteraceae bacterium]
MPCAQGHGLPSITSLELMPVPTVIYAKLPKDLPAPNQASPMSKGPTVLAILFVLFNTFAIKGQYFNFSTTGQWMWDEIRVSIPAA